MCEHKEQRDKAVFVRLLLAGALVAVVAGDVVFGDNQGVNAQSAFYVPTQKPLSKLGPRDESLLQPHQALPLAAHANT